MVVVEAREYCFWHVTAGFDSNHSLETRKRVRFLTLRFGSEYSSEIPSKSLRPSTENLNFWATHLPFSSSGVTAMDSFNILKGYGKVDPVDEQPPFLPGTRRRSVLIAVSFLAILLLTLTIGFLVGALIHESATESAESSRLTSDLTESIRAVCSVTENPDYCFSSLSPVYGWMRPDPESILKLSLVVSVKELFNASLFVKQLRKTSDEANSNGALWVCETQLEDALSRLNDSVAAMEAAPGTVVLTEVKISNIRTWVSAAMTDQETCLDGLEDRESAIFNEVRVKLQRSKDLMSNNLAIVAHMKELLDKFEMDMH